MGVEQNILFLQGLEDKTDYEKQLDEVLNHLDIVQCGKEEEAVLNSLVENERYNDGKEWSDDWCLHEGLCGGPAITQDASDGYYCELLDRAEMDLDMSAFEEEQRCHELFAKEHFDVRSSSYRHGNDTEVNKRSEMKLWGTITEIGDDYATMCTDMGKVYIPKHMFHGVDTNGRSFSLIDLDENVRVQVTAQFKGFPSSRQTAMSWRAKKIVEILEDDWNIVDARRTDCVRDVIQIEAGGDKLIAHRYTYSDTYPDTNDTR